MRYHVLIVDDEMLIREGLRRHLDWDILDMKVMAVADSAETAFTLAKAAPPDILITDICMRGKTGFDLIEDLLEIGIAPQVVLISSYNDFAYAQRAVRLQVVREYILKPVDTDLLMTLLRKIRNELDFKASAVPSALEHGVPVEKYRAFLQQLRGCGYDRHKLIQHIKSGCLEQALAVWECAEEILMQTTLHSAANRFCSNLLMTLISDGTLSETNAQDDPLQVLQSCTDCAQRCAYLRGLISHECQTQGNHPLRMQSKLIAASIEQIEKNYCNPAFHLTSLAAELNVTPNYLSIRFKEETGVGFMRFVLDKQMAKAKMLLADPQYKVYQISDMVGFLDEKYFSRQFKKLVGVTPKEYRNEHTSPV